MSAPWRASVLTLLPDAFPGPLGLSLAGQALQRRLWTLDVVNIRDFAADRYGSVDDTPFGGGAGMVMRPDVVAAALDAATAAGPERPAVYLTPRGRPLTQARLRRLAQGLGVVLLCGRFEGIDQRVVEARGLEEISIGDYVLSGGEPAALVLLDGCVRLLAGVVGAERSLVEESFADGLLEYPQFTRPQVWEQRPVPEILLSGHHGRVRDWRRAEAERVTRDRRPDLWAQYRAVPAKP